MKYNFSSPSNTSHIQLEVNSNLRKKALPLIKFLKYLFEILPLLEEEIKKIVPSLKKKSKTGEIYLALQFIGDAKMKTINFQHRHKNHTTDVLSFPIHENLRSGTEETPQKIISLGDIIISYPLAVRQAKEDKITIQQELLELFIHGLLHLLGFDHEISHHEANLQFSLERKISLKLQKENPTLFKKFILGANLASLKR
mgnify:CR=1 FL=1